MTLHQIIDKVGDNYHLGNRSLVGKSCRYLGDNNTRCAVSLFCGDDELAISRLKAMDNLCSSLADLDPDDFRNHVKCELSDVLRPEVAAAPWTFWCQLQSLHDDEKNWDAEGLTEEGRVKVAALKADWPNQGFLRFRTTRLCLSPARATTYGGLPVSRG